MSTRSIGHCNRQPVIGFRPLRRFIVVAILLSVSCGKQDPKITRMPMAAPSFWVWHRSSSLKPDEITTLQNSGVRSLYWQVAECEWEKQHWKLVQISPPVIGTANLTIFPVFRIKPESAFLGSPNAAKLLAESIRNWSGSSPWPHEIQLDFDCPTRLLGSYANFLKDFGKRVAPSRVSITALASWPQEFRFRDLALSVSSLVPMFYDLESDTPEDVKAGRFHPMADEATEKWIALWAKCPRPWLAGLPNFERLSVFEKDGRLMGHLRGWQHDPVFFHPSLIGSTSGHGSTIFQVRNTINLNGTEITPESKLVHRMADAGVLRILVKRIEQAGACGLIYFAMPGPGIQAAYSVSHLANLSDNKEAVPMLDFNKNRSITLRNPGPLDLTGVGWQLELTADHSGSFRSVSPGEFVASATPGSVPAEMSETIYLQFSKLLVGDEITSGALIEKSNSITWKLRRMDQSKFTYPE